jgi:hypothetical protein
MVRESSAKYILDGLYRESLTGCHEDGFKVVSDLPQKVRVIVNVADQRVAAPTS